MLKYSLYNESHHDAKLNVSRIGKYTYIFDYPCENHYDCTDYVIKFSPGVYKFELYGASGGSYKDQVTAYRYPNGSCIDDAIVRKVNGNVRCLKVPSIGGAGAYMSGTIYLPKETISYATIGGRGIYSSKINEFNTKYCFAKENMSEGGYGGGGYAANYDYGMNHAGSGGGQTSVKFEENDLWHRVIVSGAGGGSDNVGGTFLREDDGSGGAGGLEGQGWFSDGVYKSNYLANSTFGFSFGSGESANQFRSRNPNGVQANFGGGDRSGAGAGWYGGFVSNDGNAGSGGGSSWILSKDAVIPENEITAYDSFYEEIGTNKYAFDKTDYIFNNVVHAPGVWKGNGKLVITMINFISPPSIRVCRGLNYFSNIIELVTIS